MSEKDWKVLRKNMPMWQERHMQKLLEEYVVILTKQENPSTRFWELEKRIREDKKSIGVVVDMRRSQMENIVLQLLHEEIITVDELCDFTDEFRERIEYITTMRKKMNV